MLYLFGNDRVRLTSGLVVAFGTCLCAGRIALAWKKDGGAPGQIQKKPAPSVVRIHSADLMYTDGRQRVQIVGLLGRPLLEVVTIRGAWRRPPTKTGRPPKDPALRFLVMEVDGKRLEKEVEFRPSQMYFENLIGDQTKEPEKPTEGEVWELYGVERGGFVGLPEALYESAGRFAPQSPYYGWVPEFVYMSYKRIRPNKERE